jgi:hypothetical protein
LDTSFDFNGINDGKTLVGESGLKVENKPQSKYKKLEDEIMENMQGQLHISDPLKDKSIDEITKEDLDNIITPQHKESVRKLRELLDI